MVGTTIKKGAVLLERRINQELRGKRYRVRGYSVVCRAPLLLTPFLSHKGRYGILPSSYVRCAPPNSLAHCLYSLFASVEPPLKNESSDDGLFDGNHPTWWITGHDPLLGYPIKKVDGRRPAIPKARDFSMAGARIVEGGHKTAPPIVLAHTPRTGKPLVLLAQNGIREWWSHSGLRDPL